VEFVAGSCIEEPARWYSLSWTKEYENTREVVAKQEVVVKLEYWTQMDCTVGSISQDEQHRSISEWTTMKRRKDISEQRAEVQQE